MKNKGLYSLVSVMLLTLTWASCTDEVQELAGEQSQALKQIVMTTQDFQPEADGRTVYQVADGAVKCTWAENDTVGVFPSKGAQAYFPMASGAGTKNATFDGEGWALKDGFTYASYYPYIGNAYLDRNAVPVSYTGQTQVGNGSMAHLGDYDYMVATPTAPEFGSAQFMFKHLSALVQLKITVPQPATFTSVKLVTDTQAFAVKGKVDVMAKSPAITPVTSSSEVVLNLQNVATTKENEVVTFYMMLPPTDLSIQTLKVQVITNMGEPLEYMLPRYKFEAGKAYALIASDISNESTDGEVAITGNYSDVTISKASMKTYVKIPSNVSVYQVGVYLSLNKNPTNDNGMTLAISANAEKGLTEFSFHATKLNMNTTYYYRSYVYIPTQAKYYYGKIYTFTTQNIEEVTSGEYIDLGLGVKWASHNMGATSPEQVGDRYAWGELTSYTGDYAYKSNGSMIDIGNNICGTSYDVAYVKLGSGWRLPTYNEMTALFKQCSYVFTTYKGAVGYLVQGPNGNSIFIPYGNTNYYSGWHEDETGYAFDTHGSFAGFMTGQLSTKSGNKGRVYSLMFTNAGISKYLWYVNGTLSRDVGQSVRPVYTK